jgi:hypothetical protein
LLKFENLDHSKSDRKSERVLSAETVESGSEKEIEGEIVADMATIKKIDAAEQFSPTQNF